MFKNCVSDRLYDYSEKKSLFVQEGFETSWYKEAKEANFEDCGWTIGDENATPAYVVVRNHGKKTVVAATSENGDVEYRYILENGKIKKVLVREYSYSYCGNGEHNWLVQELGYAPYLEWVDDEGIFISLGGYNLQFFNEFDELVEEEGEERAIAIILATALQCKRYAPDALDLDWNLFQPGWAEDAWQDMLSNCSGLGNMPSPRQRVVEFLLDRYELSSIPQ